MIAKGNWNEREGEWEVESNETRYPGKDERRWEDETR